MKRKGVLLRFLFRCSARAAKSHTLRAHLHSTEFEDNLAAAFVSALIRVLEPHPLRALARRLLRRFRSRQVPMVLLKETRFWRLMRCGTRVDASIKLHERFDRPFRELRAKLCELLDERRRESDLIDELLDDDDDLVFSVTVVLPLSTLEHCICIGPRRVDLAVGAFRYRSTLRLRWRSKLPPLTTIEYRLDQAETTV